MSTYCEDLLKLKTFEKTKLVAGAQGLKRKVTWPFVVNTKEDSRWLNGGELIFITGNDMDLEDDNLFKLIQEVMENTISGIVVLTGGPFIQTLSPAIYELANKNNFPLFEMPWEMKVIDATQEIVKQIMHHSRIEEQSRVFLESLLFNKNIEENHFKELAGIYGYKNRLYKFMTVISIKAKTDDKYSSQYVENDLMHTISTLSVKDKFELITITYAEKIVCLALCENIEAIKMADIYLTSTFKMANIRYVDHQLNMGIGSVCTVASDISKSFNEALTVLNFSNIHSEDTLHYTDLGVYRLFLSIENTKEIKAYRDDVIGVLCTLTQENNSNLLKTLEVYLICSGNLTKTAQELFIHRNTLLYRLNHIKDILQKDLEDGMVRLELLNCIMIDKYLKYNINSSL